MIAKEKLPLKFPKPDPYGFGYDTGNYAGYNLTQTGIFFAYPKNNFVRNAYSCREEFYMYSFARSKNKIGFVGSYVNVKKIDEFFEFIEGQLKLEERTTFYYTTDKYGVVVDVAPFWRKNNTNKNLFTLFLRCAATYYSTGGNFWDAINRYGLSKKISHAIKRFLAGYVNPTYSQRVIFNYPYRGICDFFGDKSKEQVETLLIK